jgi:hypothetical protein
MPCELSSTSADNERIRPFTRPHGSGQVALTLATVGAPARQRIVGTRPAGCPYSFCGCGAALRVFGRIVPELNLAANWFRFPRTSPAPGMVAARRGHVFVLEQHLGGTFGWHMTQARAGTRLGCMRVHCAAIRSLTPMVRAKRTQMFPSVLI